MRRRGSQLQRSAFFAGGFCFGGRPPQPPPLFCPPTHPFSESLGILCTKDALPLLVERLPSGVLYTKDATPLRGAGGRVGAPRPPHHPCLAFGLPPMWGETPHTHIVHGSALRSPSAQCGLRCAYGGTLSLRRAFACGGRPPTPPMFLPAHPTFVHERAEGAPASRFFWAAVSGGGVSKGASPSWVARFGVGTVRVLREGYFLP